MHQVATSAGTMPVYVAVPEGAGPWPGVVVLHDALGMTSALRTQADWLAGAGYLAAAPDLYHRHPGRIRCMFGVISDVVRQHGPAFEAVESTRRWLLAREDCSGQVGTIGFCMGGGFALLLAASGDYGAASVNYGPVPNNPLELLAGACPIVASYGAKDRGLARAPKRLESALRDLGIAAEMPDNVTAVTAEVSYTLDARAEVKGPWDRSSRFVVIVDDLRGSGGGTTLVAVTAENDDENPIERTGTGQHTGTLTTTLTRDAPGGRIRRTWPLHLDQWIAGPRVLQRGLL